MMQLLRIKKTVLDVFKAKRKKSVKRKNSRFTKEQQLTFIKECQTSPLTVREYAKSKKIAESTLYLWAELSGISLKQKRKKALIKHLEDSQPSLPLERLEAQENGAGPETQKLPKVEISYIAQEFLGVLKDIAKSLIRRITGKNS